MQKNLQKFVDLICFYLLNYIDYSCHYEITLESISGFSCLFCLSLLLRLIFFHNSLLKIEVEKQNAYDKWSIRISVDIFVYFLHFYNCFSSVILNLRLIKLVLFCDKGCKPISVSSKGCGIYNRLRTTASVNFLQSPCSYKYFSSINEFRNWIKEFF